MTDIVERLRAAANEAADELEARTRAVIVIDNGQAFACSEGVAAAYGRLRALIATANAYGAGENAARLKAEAEVERLRADAERYITIRDFMLPDDVEAWAWFPHSTSSEKDAAIDAYESAVADLASVESVIRQSLGVEYIREEILPFKGK